MANKKNDKDTEQELVPTQKPIDMQENYSPANRTDSSGDEYVPPQPELSLPTQEAPKEESEYEKLLKLYDKQKKFDAGATAGEKGHGVVHGIADTVRAIANMYFSTKGAPSAYEGMSEKARERYAKAKAERDKHREELYNYAMNMRKMENSDNMLKWQMERAAADAAALKEHRAAQLAEQQRHNEANESIAQQRANTAQQNANTNEKRANASESKAKEALIKAKQGISGYSKTTTYEYDIITGKPISVTVVRTPNGEEYKFKEGGSKTNSGNLLPPKPTQGKTTGSLLPNK